MKNLKGSVARISILLLITAIIILLSEWDGYQRAKSKYDKPISRDTLKIEIQADTAAIIQRATAGMVQYDPKSESQRESALAKAREEVARLNAWLDSLTRTGDLDSLPGDSLDLILFPSLEADSLITWSGEDSTSGLGWSAELDHSQVVIPLLSEIRNNYHLDIEFYYPPAETTYIDHGGNEWTWWEKGAVGLGFYLGWKLKSDIK